MFKSLIPASLVVVAVAAACAGAGGTPVPTVAPPAATVAPSSPAAAAAGPTVSVSSDGYFVGPNGLTLYTFDKDAADTSNCQSGQCLQNWPALTAAGGAISLGTGLTASDFNTITRTDGSSQVTFKGIPLYFFAGDAAPGDKHGDGVGGIWHLATTSSTVPAAGGASPAASAPASAPAGTPAGSTDGQICYDRRYQPVPCAS